MGRCSRCHHRTDARQLIRLQQTPEDGLITKFDLGLLSLLGYRMDYNVLSDTLLGTVTQETTPEDEADYTVSGAAINSTSITHNQSLKAHAAIVNVDEARDAPTAEMTMSDVNVEAPNGSGTPKKPLNLLDLPLDILREIVKEVH